MNINYGEYAGWVLDEWMNKYAGWVLEDCRGRGRRSQPRLTGMVFPNAAVAGSIPASRTEMQTTA